MAELVQDYIQSIQKYSALSFEAEQELAKRWREHRDERAFSQLMQSYLRLVVKVAMSYRGYGLPLEELVQEGNIGLMQGINRFEPERGFRLSTYAMWWIKAHIQEYILNNWSMVKIGTSSTQKKLFFNLRRLKAEMLGEDSIHLTPEAIKQIAGQRKGQLMDALSKLDERERAIFVARHLTESEETPTLEQLSGQYGVSRERVRQLEERAYRKVQGFMQPAVLH